ncbi:MAG: S8 family serine peptidase [Bacteroidales bacterium]|jgi:subtilisin family serine protease|nr:S8 family serine peptidase [Bacteroidales bacterium]
MKRKLIFTIVANIILLYSLNLSAQDYKIKLKNQIIEFDNQEETKKIKSSDFKDVGKYFIIQFKNIPDEYTKKQLYESGVELLDYIPEFAYIAKKYKGDVKISAKSDLSIKRIEEFKPEYKLDYRIYNKDFPKWATPELGRIKIIVEFFEEVNVNSESFTDLKINGFEQIAPVVYEVEISESELTELAKFEEVKWIELIKPEKQLHNKNLRTLHRVNVVNADLSIGKGLFGQGIIIGQFDGGEVYPHNDLIGNITAHTDIGYSDHATHVAGTIIGKGLIDPELKGMAPDANLHSWDFYVDDYTSLTDSAIYEENLNLVTNSWGYAFSPYNCYSPTPYSYFDKEYDRIALKYPRVLQLFSVGNDRQSCSGGYKTAGWNMKNVLFVGAVDNKDNLASFSSCGPLYDGRIVPHIVGMGVDVYSTEFDRYVAMSGTSMSTPGATGSIALLYEAYFNEYTDYPTSSLVKALVCNTAKDLGNPGPDYQYGFGRIDILKAIESIENERFIEGEMRNEAIIEHPVIVEEGTTELKVTLAWNDIPPYPGAAYALVNDFDIKVELPNGDILFPLVLNPEKPSENATEGVDNINNIEQIIVKSPQAGEYKLKIIGKEIQNLTKYSIAYSTQQNDLKLTFPIGKEKLINGNEEYIRWNSSNISDPVDLYISNDSGTTWKEIAIGLDAESRSYKYTISDSIFSNTNIIKIVQGETSYASEPFTIAPVSKKINFNPAFESSLIKWEKVYNASSYNVFSIKDGKLELLETVTDTFYTANNLETNEAVYFTIQSFNSDQVISQRNIASSVEAIPRIDLGIECVVSPLSGDLLGEEEEVTVRLINKGAEEIFSGTEITLEYVLNGADPVVDTLVLMEDFLPGETMDYTFSRTVYMAIKKYYELKLQVSHPEDTVLTRNNEFVYDILHFGEITEYPYKQTFDKVNDLKLYNSYFEHVYLGKGWENDYLNDDFEWWPWSSDTYQDGTGPSKDHTSGEGKFLYTESYFLEGESGVMNLCSPHFNISNLTQPFISFWYHMYAESMEMGTLFLDVYSVNEDQWYENIWSESGNQGNLWKNALIDVSEYKNKGFLKFRFRVVTSTNYQNSIAIDDFELYEGNILDLKIDSVGINEEGGLLSDNEKIKIYYSNIGGKDIQAGEKIKFIYEVNDDLQVAEEFVVIENITPGDNLVYEFTTPAQLGDITHRNHMDFEIYYLKDNKKENNKITNYAVQSYNEPKSACEAGYYLLGVLNFNFNGVYPETSIENYNTLCANTEVSGYSFYGEQTAVVYQGYEYEMGVQPIFYTLIQGLDPVGQYVKAWIDYDQNGYFEPDEAIFELDHRGIAYTLENVTIPHDAVLGLTGLRVRTSYYKSDLLGEDAAHRDYDLGETEDYTIEIKERPDINVGLADFIKKPQTFSNLKSDELLSIRLANMGLTDINANSEFKFSYSINGNVFSENYTNQEILETEEFIEYEFTKKLDLSQEGKYYIKAWVDFEGDIDQYNDTVYLDVINLTEVSGIDYIEDFENIENAEWFATASKNKTVWQQGSPGTQYINRSHSGTTCWATVLDSNYLSNNEAILYSPLFDFSGTESVTISFWISTHAEPGYDGLILESSFDGIQWEKVGENEYGFYDIEYLGDADLGNKFWSDYSIGWRKKEIELNNLCNQKAAFRFRFYSDENQVFDGAALDDFEIKTTETTTSIDGRFKNNHFSVYPNPFLEGININCSEFRGSVMVKVIDVNGKSVYETSVSDHTESFYLNLSTLKSGIYILQCVDETSVYNQQIIKY